MAIEAKRGCGYRKVNGIYLVMDAGGFECDRLPLELSVCPCCGEGVKFSRVFTWIQPQKLFGGDHVPPCTCQPTDPTGEKIDEILLRVCPVCRPSYHFGHDGKAGLMWIGEKFYSPESFSAEAAQLGISKRISAIPHGFKVGETWIFLAHKKAVKPDRLFINHPTHDSANDPKPGVFMAFKPARIEKIVLESDLICHREINNWIHADDGDGDPDTILTRAKDRFGITAFDTFCQLYRDISRGFTLIPVPDDDTDHNPAAVHSNVKDAEYLPDDEPTNLMIL